MLKYETIQLLCLQYSIVYDYCKLFDKCKELQFDHDVVTNLFDWHIPNVSKVSLQRENLHFIYIKKVG